MFLSYVFKGRNCWSGKESSASTETPACPLNISKDIVQLTKYDSFIKKERNNNEIKNDRISEQKI